MGLLLQNMKFHIFHNGYESIFHNIIQGRPLPTMCTTKKMNGKDRRQMQCDTPRIKRWERPDLIHNAMEKNLKAGGEKND
jgi:hypothetical protein